MQNRSNLPISAQEKHFPPDYPAICSRYTQRYQAENSLHYHNCLELGRCVSGGGVQFIGGELYPFSPNTLTIIQKHCVHDSHIIMPHPYDPPSTWQYVFADLDALGVPDSVGCSFAAADHTLLWLFQMMFEELEGRREGWQDQFLYLLRAYLGQAARCAHGSTVQADVPMADEIAAVQHYIAREYPEDLTVEALAKRSSMSVSYFRRMFTLHVGMCPQQYILHVRLSMAEHLLRTTKQSILNVAHEVGFRSLSSFNRQFRKNYGCTPRDVRRAE